jgi:hypothetical protein
VVSQGVPQAGSPKVFPFVCQKGWSQCGVTHVESTKWDQQVSPPSRFPLVAPWGLQGGSPRGLPNGCFQHWGSLVCGQTRVVLKGVPARWPAIGVFGGGSPKVSPERRVSPGLAHTGVFQSQFRNRGLKSGTQRWFHNWWPQEGSARGSPEGGAQVWSPIWGQQYACQREVPQVLSHMRILTSGYPKWTPTRRPKKGIPQIDRPRLVPEMYTKGCPSGGSQGGSPKVGSTREAKRGPKCGST